MRRAREDPTGFYRFRKATLIDLLQITPAEECHMRALISEAEKRRRDAVRQRQRRRAAGLIERAEYEAPAAGRRPLVIEMRARAMTWRTIGVELGISEGETRRIA